MLMAVLFFSMIILFADQNLTATVNFYNNSVVMFNPSSLLNLNSFAFLLAEQYYEMKVSISLDSLYLEVK